jgi:hypothetical protein
MKIAPLLLIGTFLLISCSSKNSKLPEFSFNDTTYLKCHIKNCKTPGDITLSYVSVCPLEQLIMNIHYEKDTTRLIPLFVNHPVTINLISPVNSATCFALPKDTIEIYFDLFPRERNQKITFKGKNASIANYLTNAKYNISSAPKNFESVEEYTNRVDYLISKGLFELHKFDSKTPLPDWFVKMEELDIKYSGARDKVYQFKIRQRFHYSYRLIPTDYLDELDVKFNNPKAKYSLSYYGFLNNYSTINIHDFLGIQNISPDDTYKYIIENIRTGQKRLHSELKELYTSQRICALLSKPKISQALRTNDSLYFQRVDSLINSARDNFNDDGILNALLNYQKKQFKLALD